MDIRELQQAVRRSHDQHFGHTGRRERLRDLSHQVAELIHHRDEGHLDREIGDVGWALCQLCNERGMSLAEAIMSSIDRLDAEAPGKSVALIGTSANPITYAHITLGLEMLAVTEVDECWYLLPGKHPWGKKLMPAEHRVEMVRLATARYARLKVCDFEVAHGDEIYPNTTETAFILRDYLLPAFPSYSFSWVMGSDVAQSFHRWDGADWMAEHLRIFVVFRQGYDFDKDESLLADERHQYFRDGIVTSNISSTLVRQRGQEYDPAKVRALVPDVVWQYLEEHRLLDPEVLPE